MSQLFSFNGKWVTHEQFLKLKYGTPEVATEETVETVEAPDVSEKSDDDLSLTATEVIKQSKKNLKKSK